MKKLYFIWIRLKYQYYKLYWEIKSLRKSRGEFCGWSEGPCYSILDQKAIAIGVIDEKISKQNT